MRSLNNLYKILNSNFITIDVTKNRKKINGWEKKFLSLVEDS